ncbi:hypothetical protein [Agarilytica rhodophyticola]|uniref:hypothetical protein n=1 Tax=Agarilytica rhodophyticola TaxID=1737490 RepID=UPI000B3410BF|nr:hypothetical protein [Agarilytica rhodophyticola]
MGAEYGGRANITEPASLSNEGWVGQLRASVRPVITYLFFTLFAPVKACTLYILITDHNIHLYQALPQI